MRITPGIDADSIGQMMVRLEASDQLRQANAAVLAHLRAQPIVAHWGQDLSASAERPHPRADPPQSRCVTFSQITFSDVSTASDLATHIIST
jgi:hypothetical protein